MSQFALLSRPTLVGAAAVTGLAACGRNPPKTGGAKLEADLKAYVTLRQPPGLVAVVAHGDQTHLLPLGAMTLDGRRFRGLREVHVHRPDIRRPAAGGCCRNPR